MRRTATLLLLAGITTFAIGWQRVNQLQHNGKTVSTNLQVVDGVLMVSAKDVASYLGGDLSVENGTATIKTNGKPDPMAVPGGNSTGVSLPVTDDAKPEPKEFVVRTGDPVTNEGFGLTVVSVEDAAKGDYRTMYDGRDYRYRPRQKDDRLVVIKMKVQNKSGETARPPVPTAFDATLFDASGVGFPVLGFDARSALATEIVSDMDTYRPLDAPLLTAEGTFEFAAIFSVPKQSALKRLTVVLPANDDNGAGTKVMVDLEQVVNP